MTTTLGKTARWTLLVSLVALVGVSLVLAFMLSLTGESRLYEQHLVWLFWVNVVVAGALVLAIAIAAVRLWLRQRKGKFGTRLLIKLAGIFALVGVLPGTLIYTVSYQFVTRSIETWFDARVAGALDAGLALGRGTLDALSQDLATKTRLAADRLAEARTPPTALVLERLREQLAAREVSLLGTGGQVIATAGGSADAIAPERPPAALLRNARASRPASLIEGLDDEPGGVGPRTNARVRVVAVLPNAADLAGAQRGPFPDGGAGRAAAAGGPMRWRCRRPTASTSSAPSRATACAACTSAR